MASHDDMPSLFHMLKVKSIDSSNWSMAKVMHNVLLKATKATFVHANFIVVNVDEITTIDNTQWLSIHLYTVQGWKRIPILLCVESIVVFATSNNIFGLMVKGLLKLVS